MEENKNLMENPIINDNSTRPVEENDIKLSLDLLNGTTISFDVDDMDWGGLYNNISELDKNIGVLKTMINDLIRIEPGDTRDGAATAVFGESEDFLKSINITDLNYEVRPEITIYEKAMLICMDCILILETIINYARINALTKLNTESLIDEILNNTTIDEEELTYMMNDVTSFTDANPINFDESEEGDAT